MDRDLVVRARGGDHEAFATIASTTIGRLTSIARLILHDEDRAQDAVQETLIDAWRGLRGLRDPERMDAWLNRMLVRACHDRARRDWRRGVREIDLTADRDRPIPGEQGRVDARDHMERCLARLPVDQRAVLVLTYYVDLPLAEAAQVLRIPIGTMKSRLNRALQTLRAQIDADDRLTAGAQERLA